MKQLSSDENIYQLIEESSCLLLQYGDEGCGPCHAIHHRLDLWLQDHPRVRARYIPVGSFRELSAQMGVFTVPTVRFYIEGKKAAEESGYFSLDRMLDRVERYLQMI